MACLSGLLLALLRPLQFDDLYIIAVSFWPALSLSFSLSIRSSLHMYVHMHYIETAAWWRSRVDREEDEAEAMEAVCVCGENDEEDRSFMASNCLRGPT